ncbi:MAG TPA: hypothetical protein VHQ87_05685 [Rhizobacter sp.]|nr:hypothetical protein [Rhizobacter sp.]
MSTTSRPHASFVRHAALALCALSAFAFAPPAAAATAYTYTPLLSLGGEQGTGQAINNLGQVAGGSFALTGSYFWPTLWTTPGTPVQLGLLPNPALAVAYGLNDRGQAVGSDAFSRAILWNGTQATELPSLGGSSSEAIAINNAGQAVGWSFTSPTSSFQATLWQGGQATNLGTLGGRTSFATDINTSGQIAGIAEGSFGRHAVLWNNGVARDLGTVQGHESGGEGLNDAGQVVGFDVDDQGASHASYWDGNRMSLLRPVEGDGVSSAALDINNRGLAVGYSVVQGNQSATLWDRGAPTDLNSFLDPASRAAGWHLLEAAAINENGWITGMAINSSLGESSAFLLTTVPAIPEPSAFALALAGLVVLGAGRLRPRHRVIARTGPLARRALRTA